MFETKQTLKGKTTYSMESSQHVYRRRMGCKRICNELGIPSTKTLRLWVKNYHEHCLKGLEERRGTSKSPLKGRPRKNECSLEEENRRLKAENEYLKRYECW